MEFLLKEDNDVNTCIERIENQMGFRKVIITKIKDIINTGNINKLIIEKKPPGKPWERHIKLYSDCNSCDKEFVAPLRWWMRGRGRREEVPVNDCEDMICISCYKSNSHKKTDKEYKDIIFKRHPYLNEKNIIFHNKMDGGANLVTFTIIPDDGSNQYTKTSYPYEMIRSRFKGFYRTGNASKPSIECFEYLMTVCNITILHEHNNDEGEFAIYSSSPVDGYTPNDISILYDSNYEYIFGKFEIYEPSGVRIQGIVWEYYGDYIHLNPIMYSENDKCYDVKAKDKWEKDEKKREEYMKNGYIVVVIWGKTWKELKKILEINIDWKQSVDNKINKYNFTDGKKKGWIIHGPHNYNNPNKPEVILRLKYWDEENFINFIYAFGNNTVSQKIKDIVMNKLFELMETFVKDEIYKIEGEIDKFKKKCDIIYDNEYKKKINFLLRYPLKDRLLTREKIANKIKDKEEGGIVIARTLRFRISVNGVPKSFTKCCRLVDSVKEKGKRRNKIYDTKELADKAIIDYAIERQKNLLKQQQLKHTNSGSSQHS